MRGYRVLYLGADTPIDQIAAAVTSDIAAVALSISPALPRSRAAKGMRSFAALCRDGCLSGSAAPARPGSKEWSGSSPRSLDSRL